MIVNAKAYQIWFLKPDNTDNLTIQIKKALVRLGDRSEITHTVFRPSSNLIYDVTVIDNYLSYLESEQIEELMSMVKFVVEIKPKHPSVNYHNMMRRIDNQRNLNIKLDIGDLQHWYRHKGDKDDILLCTDVIVDVLDMHGTIPDNLLPSQLLYWFDDNKDNYDVLDKLNAESIEVIELTNGQLHQAQ